MIEELLETDHDGKGDIDVELGVGGVFADMRGIASGVVGLR